MDARVAEQAIEQRIMDRRSRGAARSQWFRLAADYGQSAVAPFNKDRATRTFGVTMMRTDRWRLHRRAREGRLERAAPGRTLYAGNTRGQVEQDVRQALIAWNLSLAQVQSADEQLGIADRELA
ncbi:MAG: hypothetical protein WKG07_17610 [Hymenobacter sp.]